MKKSIRVIVLLFVIIAPQLVQAQGVADEIGGLQAVLDQLYNEMLPLCSQLIGVGRGLAGFGATWYIGARRHRRRFNLVCCWFRCKSASSP